MAQKNDELNIHDEFSDVRRRVLDIMTYFGEMDLTDEQKEKRIKMASEMEQFLIMLLLMLQAEIRLGNEIDVNYYTDYAKRRLMDTADANLRAYKTPEIGSDIEKTIEASLGQRIVNLIALNVEQIIDTTVKNSDDSYFTSAERATLIAENEANSICNCEELEEAVRMGYKYKTWITMQDRKVRHTHWAVDSDKIGIYDAFKVGRCKMLAPMIFDDGSPEDAKEVINCRCTLSYTKK